MPPHEPKEMNPEEDKEKPASEGNSDASESQPAPTRRGWLRDLPPARDPMGAGGDVVSSASEPADPAET
jgi:hypothetical protein